MHILVVFYNQNIIKNLKSKFTYTIFFLINQYVLIFFLILKHKKRYKENIHFISFGVGERVRTSAPITRPSSLANCPLHHLGTPT